MSKLILCLAALGLMIVPSISLAQDREEFTITIKDHLFDPAELKIPSGKKIKLIVINQDSTDEEFESFDLDREKVIAGHGKIGVFLGPLKPGVYKYFGEFHQKTAQGKIIVE